MLAAIFLGAPLYWLAFPPRLPIGTANGIFSSACCGYIKLRDGVLTIGNGQKVAYVVEHDKVGRYVLPMDYLGASTRGLTYNKGGNPMVLCLDDEPRPNRIEMINDASNEIVEFNRRNGS